MPSRASSRWKRSADSSTSKFVWAAIRSIRCAAHAEDPVGVELDAEAVAHRLDPVDDDAGRLGRLGEFGGVGEDRRDPRPELGHALAHRRGDRDGLDPLLRPGLAERRPGLGGGRQVDLVEGDQHRLVEERRIVRPELLADDVVVPLGVARRAVDDVDEDPRPLDVAQERVTEPGAAAGALDEARDVGDRRAALVLVAEVHDPEVRLERRERVVGDLGRRRGHGGEDRRLARVRQPDQPDVGDQPELEAEPALGARLALLGVLGGLVGGGLEVGVAEAAPPAAGDHRGLADRHEVGDQGTGLVVVDGRAGRNVEDEVVAGLAVPPGARAAAAGRRPEVVPVVEVAQRRLAGIDPQVDGSAATAVAAVGSAARDVGLLPEGRGPVAAIAGADPDLHAVEEHRGHSRTLRGRVPVGAQRGARTKRATGSRAG